MTARGRSRAGLLTSTAAFLLWAALAAAGWYGRHADALGLSGAWLLVAFGPSALPGSTERVPLSTILGAHPVAVRVAIAAALGAAFVGARRHAGRVSPLSEEAVRRQDVALAILAPMLLVVMQLVCIGLVAALSSSL